MTKSTIRTFTELAEYAKARAAKSLARNDPWAFAYWRETQAFAENFWSTFPKAKLATHVQQAVRLARRHMADGHTTQAALWYSRAKWFVILARNNGMVMNPRTTGVNMSVFKELAS
jgi:outer membrane protein assembly factor BamD (BamD/ComL family)